MMILFTFRRFFHQPFAQLFSGTLFPLFFGGCPTKSGPSPKKGSFFSRVTEQPSLSSTQFRNLLGPSLPPEAQPLGRGAGAGGGRLRGPRGLREVHGAGALRAAQRGPGAHRATGAEGRRAEWGWTARRAERWLSLCLPGPRELCKRMRNKWS